MIPSTETGLPLSPDSTSLTGVQLPLATDDLAVAANHEHAVEELSVAASFWMTEEAHTTELASQARELRHPRVRLFANPIRHEPPSSEGWSFGEGRRPGSSPVWGITVAGQHRDRTGASSITTQILRVERHERQSTGKG